MVPHFFLAHSLAFLPVLGQTDRFFKETALFHHKKRCHTDEENRDLSLNKAGDSSSEGRRAIKVRPGQSDPVIVLEGLRKGDKVVVRGNEGLRDGDRIQVPR